MDHYVVIKNHLDLNDNIFNDVKLFYKDFEAKAYFCSEIDKLKGQVAFYHSVGFEEFDLADFGDIEQFDNKFIFKDYAGKFYIQLEIKNI